MRPLLVALLVAAAAVLGACGAGEPTTRGTVVGVHEIPLGVDRQDSGKYYEHPLVPEVGWKIEVQLDDGSMVTVEPSAERRYEPGDRVRLLMDADGALLL